jgi:hypothetical protein
MDLREGARHGRNQGRKSCACLSHQVSSVIPNRGARLDEPEHCRRKRRYIPALREEREINHPALDHRPELLISASAKAHKTHGCAPATG